MDDSLATELQVTSPVDESNESVTIPEIPDDELTSSVGGGVALSYSTVDSEDYSELLAYQSELLAYQNARLDELVGLATYSFLLNIIVLGVIVAKWISSIFNAV